ncbi:HAD family hydrolase [Deltaproteobacteria bacterium TL4]
MNWKTIRLVIFDVDGTLYNQSKFRKRMLRTLLGYYIFHPWNVYDLKILSDFRLARESHAGEEIDNLEQVQYSWSAKISRVSCSQVILVVEKWIFQKPLKLLSRFLFDGVLEFINILDQSGIEIVFFSDYPAEKKLQALGINSYQSFSSTDSEINALKPHPKGIHRIMEVFDVSPHECVMIGDRNDRDGEIARRANISYLLIDNKRKMKTSHCFHSYPELMEEVKRNRNPSQIQRNFHMTE